MYLSLNLHSSGCSGRVRGCVKSKGGSEEGGTKKNKDVKQLHFCDRYPFGVVSCARSHDPPRARPHEHIHTLIMYIIMIILLLILQSFSIGSLAGGVLIRTPTLNTHMRCFSFCLGLLFSFTINDFRIQSGF